MNAASSGSRLSEQLDNITLGDHSDIVLAVLAGKLKGRAGDALPTLLSQHFEVNSQVVVDLNALVAPDVFALDVLSEEGSVDALLRDADGPDGGEQIQTPAQERVGTHQIGQALPSPGGDEGTLHQHIALFAFLEHIVGEALHLLHPVFDGHPLDGAKLNVAGGDFFLQEILHYPQGLLHDDRADAVSGQDTDNDVIQFGVIGDLGVLLHRLDALILAADKLSEFFLCGSTAGSPVTFS